MNEQAKDYKFIKSRKFQLGPLLWVLNLIGNNAFRRGFHLNPLLTSPNDTIVNYHSIPF